jgi:hypothetical protein
MDTPQEWLRLSAKILEHSRQFSWDESARRLHDLLVELVPGGGSPH